MKKLIFLFIASFFAIVSFSQKQQFEEPKVSYKSDSLKVKIGGDLGIQYQAIKCKADSPLVPLGNGFNLPTANLNIDGFLAKGIKVNLVAYLSSRHHEDTYVKGGYLLIDDLSFLHNSEIDEAMKYLTIKVGFMDLNYGDQHFRRTDNGRLTSNPFIGNYILDPYTTAPALEITYRPDNGIIGMVGLTNGTVNPLLVAYKANKQFYSYNLGDELAYYGKIGYDKKISNDLRVRGTISFYIQDDSHSGTLYAGDRTGSRYYLVMVKRTIPSGSSTDVDITSNFLTGNWGTGAFHNDMSGLINLFIKYKGLELFGHIEQAKGITAYIPNSTNGISYKFNQIGIEGIYRFGKDEQYYIGCKYNTVTAHWDQNKADYSMVIPASASIPNQSIYRVEGVIGWWLNKYIVTKIEYVDQEYSNFTSPYISASTDYGKTANFKGIMVEAGISF